MSSRFEATPYNDFVEPMGELKLAQHSENTDVLFFMEESCRIAVIEMTINQLIQLKDVSVLNNHGRMYWVMTTLADTFVFGTTESHIISVVGLYTFATCKVNTLTQKQVA